MNKPKSLKIMPIVNDHDEIIGYKTRDEIASGDFIHRVTALWVTNKEGNILLGKRSKNKRFVPGLWAPPVAGSVEKGETYDTNIIKEAKEELGIEAKSFKKLEKHFSPEIHNNHFTQWYVFELNEPIEEIDFCNEHEEIHWFTPEELKKLVVEQPEIFVFGVRKIVTERL